MAKPNYQFEKRQRDLAKKSKQEEKRRQKLIAKAGEHEPADPSVSLAEAADALASSPAAGPTDQS